MDIVLLMLKIILIWWTLKELGEAKSKPLNAVIDVRLLHIEGQTTLQRVGYIVRVQSTW